MFYYKTINEDISDGMIEDNAKIWCMFCNTDVSKALDDAIKQTEEKAAEDIKDIVGKNKKENSQQNSDSDSDEVDESMLNEKVRLPQRGPNGRFLPKSGSGPKSTPKPSTPKPPTPKPSTPKPKTPKPAPKPGPKPGPETGAPKKSAFGKVGNLTGQAAVNLGKGAAKHPWMTLASAGAYMNRDTIAELYDLFKGKGNPDNIKVSEDGTPDVDSWNKASFKDLRAAVASSKVDIDKLSAFDKWKYLFIAPRADKGWPAENILLSLAAAWGLWKSRNYIWSRVKELADWISSGKSLAVCEFSSDGDTYKAEFDIKAKKWKLYYAGSTITKELSYPPKEVADKFFSTKFFEKLTETCWKHTNKYLNDKAFAAIASAACSTKGISSSSKAALKDIFKHRKLILENLKNGKYEYI